MPSRENCDAILDILKIFKSGLQSPLVEINEEVLNHSFSKKKMSIGQIALHCSAWPVYFLSDPKPWKVVKWTCAPCTYPLKIEFVNEMIEKGFEKLITTLKESNDELLEVNEKGEKGFGYIIYRLLIHILAHSNQMSYLRQLHDPEWQFGSNFGDMATAIIQLPYSTSRDLKIRGF